MIMRRIFSEIYNIPNNSHSQTTAFATILCLFMSCPVVLNPGIIRIFITNKIKETTFYLLNFNTTFNTNFIFLPGVVITMGLLYLNTGIRNRFPVRCDCDIDVRFIDGVLYKCKYTHYFYT